MAQKIILANRMKNSLLRTDFVDSEVFEECFLFNLRNELRSAELSHNLWNQFCFDSPLGATRKAQSCSCFHFQQKHFHQSVVESLDLGAANGGSNFETRRPEPI